MLKIVERRAMRIKSKKKKVKIIASFKNKLHNFDVLLLEKPAKGKKRLKSKQRNKSRQKRKKKQKRRKRKLN